MRKLKRYDEMKAEIAAMPIPAGIGRKNEKYQEFRDYKASYLCS